MSTTSALPPSDMPHPTDAPSQYTPEFSHILPLSTKDRQDSLEKHLQQRPDMQDLKERNILLPTSAAPSLQAKQKELERQQASDALRKGLAKRPERDELVERNVLPASNAAPALLSHQRNLERHMRSDSLEQQLASRPPMEVLVKEGILREDENPVKDD